MAWKNCEKNVIVEFLRSKLTDPRSRAESLVTDTFSGTGVAQICTLTPATNNHAYAITDVSVDSSSVSKWVDYNIDMQNQNISGTFASGTDNIVVTYKTGTTNWIYSDLAKTSLKTSSYPRINVSVVGSNGDFLGSYKSEIIETVHFQTDIWVKEDYIYNDGTNKWTGSHLALYLARQIVKQFEDYNNDLYPILFNFMLLNMRDAVWESDRECCHVILEFQMDGISLGG